ncbi:MAG TPA: SWIM zinc finger family protein [Thermodesulfobacteriota bacterium]|nr:SWIM zinc finger family protein [Thermodesulfobacteriota bacterium]
MNKELKGSKERYIKGQELYRSGAVSIGKDGCFYVHNYLVDVEKVWCNCPDYQHRKQACKHYYAVRAYLKYGKPKTINGNGAGSESSRKNAPETHLQGNSKDLGEKNTKARLSVLNNAIQILQSQNSPLHMRR